VSKEVIILFGGGFISHNIAKNLHEIYDIILITKKEYEEIKNKDYYKEIFSNCDLTEIDNIKYVERELYYRWPTIINCASYKTHDKKEWDSLYFYYKNLKIFKTFLWLSSRLLKPTIINLGSGAEFEKWNLYSEAKKDIYDIFSSLTFKSKDYYHLRVFGLFGEEEPLHRFTNKCFEGAIRKEKIYCKQKLFDYFSVYDLCRIIDKCTGRIQFLPQEINCVYKYPISLADFAYSIYSLYDKQASKYIVVDGVEDNFVCKEDREVFTSWFPDRNDLTTGLKKLKEEYYDKKE